MCTPSHLHRVFTLLFIAHSGASSPAIPIVRAWVINSEKDEKECQQGAARNSRGGKSKNFEVTSVPLAISDLGLQSWNRREKIGSGPSAHTRC